MGHCFWNKASWHQDGSLFFGARHQDESLFFDTGISVLFDHPYTGEEIYSFDMWKDGHLVYFASKYPENEKNNLKFTIPNSVYENIIVYCKK